MGLLPSRYRWKAAREASFICSATLDGCRAMGNRDLRRCRAGLATLLGGLAGEFTKH
jgi:hypothetical protein